MSAAEIERKARAQLERLCKWRGHFAGWQLGTRPDTDPEAQAIRDHREVTMIMRAELSALAGILIEKGVMTAEEFTERVGNEAELLYRDYEARWPGTETTDHGISYDIARGVPPWMSNWKP